MKRLQSSELVRIAFLIGLVALAYGQLVKGYFATDEWWGFSYAVARQTLAEILAPEGVYAPSSNLFIVGLYRTFGINPLPWAILTLTLHSLNTLMVYWLGKRLAEDWRVGLTAASLFALLPMGSQFLHQFSMLPTSGMATFFGFSALLAYAYRRPWVAALLLLIGFSFSPYTSPFIVLAFLVECVLLERKRWWRSLLAYLPVIAAFGLYYWTISEKSLKSAQLHDRPVSGESGQWERLQSIGQKLYQSYGELYAQLPGTIDPDLMIRYSTIILLLVLVPTALLCLKKQYRLCRVALLGLLWIPASLTLFSTLNTVVIDATFPSRYFYVTTVGVGLVLSSLLVGLLPGKMTVPLGRLKLATTAGTVALFIVVLGLMLQYLPKTRSIVKGEVELGETRKMIVETVIASVPKPIGRDGLFCFTSNEGHYGQTPVIMPLPFAHNFAFSLAVHYRAEDRLLKDFFTESGYFVNPSASFYYFSRDQRDKDGLGPGIGYATNATKCKEMKDKFSLNLGLEDVHAFAYDGKRKMLINITEPMRRYLAGDNSELAWNALHPF